jgi:hypothetical protein
MLLLPLPIRKLAIAGLALISAVARADVLSVALDAAIGASEKPWSYEEYERRLVAAVSNDCATSAKCMTSEAIPRFRERSVNTAVLGWPNTDCEELR